jgi:hypothetical protein
MLTATEVRDLKHRRHRQERWQRLFEIVLRENAIYEHFNEAKAIATRAANLTTAALEAEEAALRQLED